MKFKPLRLTEKSRWLLEHIAIENHGDECIHYPFPHSKNTKTGLPKPPNYGTSSIAKIIAGEGVGCNTATFWKTHRTVWSCGDDTCINRHHIQVMGRNPPKTKQRQPGVQRQPVVMSAVQLALNSPWRRALTNDR